MHSLRDLPPALRKALTLSNGSLESLALELGYHGGRSGQAISQAIKASNDLEDAQLGMHFMTALANTSLSEYDATDGTLEAAAIELETHADQAEQYETLHEEIGAEFERYLQRSDDAGTSPDDEPLTREAFGAWQINELERLIRRVLGFGQTIKEGNDPWKLELAAEKEARKRKRT